MDHYLNIDGLRLASHQDAAETIAHYVMLRHGDDALFAAACTHAAILTAIRGRDSMDNFPCFEQLRILIQEEGHPLGDMFRNHILIIVGMDTTEFITPPNIMALQKQVMNQAIAIMNKMAPVAMMDTLGSLENHLRAAGFPA